jgi:hypothetical protein
MHSTHRVIALTLVLVLGIGSALLAQTSAQGRSAPSGSKEARLRKALVTAATSVFSGVVTELDVATRRALASRLRCDEKSIGRKMAARQIETAQWLKDISDAEIDAILAGRFDDKANRRKVAAALATMLRIHNAPPDGVFAFIGRRASSGRLKGAELEFVARSLGGYARRLAEVQRRIERLERLDEQQSRLGRLEKKR